MTSHSRLTSQLPPFTLGSASTCLPRVRFPPYRDRRFRTNVTAHCAGMTRMLAFVRSGADRKWQRSAIAGRSGSGLADDRSRFFRL